MKILAYDIESVSGRHNGGSMCSFGYCKSDDTFAILEQDDLVMCPNSKRYETKIKLHYIKAYIKAQPKFTEFYQSIKQLFCEADCIIGFSVINDVEFLNDACRVYGLDRIEYKFIDVQLLYKAVYKLPTMPGLEKLAEELNISYLAHRSDEDARVTLLVLKHLCLKEGLTLNDLLRKYGIAYGSNTKTETIPCTDGTFTKREKNYLILNFVEKHYSHNFNYKGGLSFKKYAFADDVRYNDIDLIRKIIKKIYSLNGRISSIESSNVLVHNGTLTEKEQKAFELRNSGRERIKKVTLDELLETLQDLPELDFSSDMEEIRKHRAEIKKQREEKRAEQRAEQKRQFVKREFIVTETE